MQSKEFYQKVLSRNLNKTDGKSATFQPNAWAQSTYRRSFTAIVIFPNAKINIT